MKRFCLNILVTLFIIFRANAILEDLSSENYEDSNSMEELTTMSNFNEQLFEVNLPVQTTSIVEMMAQSVSPMLMKMRQSIESTDNPADISEFIEKSSEDKSPRFLPIDSRNDSELEESVEDTTTLLNVDADNNETNIDIGEEITTLPSHSTSKRPPKNIEIFKTRPNELLRYYVEDGHLRSPIAALVDKKSNPLFKAKKLWKAALRPNSLLDIMVVSYDSEGIKSTYNLTNTKAMMATLDKVREENATDQESKTYYSVIRTGQLIPFDSAIFLSTDCHGVDDCQPKDTEHQVQASMFLLKKRIRLYLIIFDEKVLANESHGNHAMIKDTGYLGQLALLTGGDIIYVPNSAFPQNDGAMGYITLLRGSKLKAIDQELRDVQENELKSDTEAAMEIKKAPSNH